ncbi:MAG: SIS domain-containing protein [Blastocatellia bacterium]|nr:SIS domain-containing protein [Blastocatellia bacterium]MCS7157967.1 SIS domain-containing protein [Blastocatellia bacterium]MCX7752474.1 SIS domain-containing protein [Blastocatellia bacterium]MDW8167411.1 SIS domain-containing protein [Acidobacteriota bacterium]MDW8257411.1 SIS domain-containing protein [Acidobacteriota bacterium]
MKDGLERTFTYREVYGQPEAMSETLRRAPARFARMVSVGPLERFTEVIFTGCGSSYHIALYAAHAWGTLLGLRARALPASEILNFSKAHFHAEARPLIFAISRSGGTDETVLAAERAKAVGATVVSVTTNPECPLARTADVHLSFSECLEQSLVTTGSLTCMMLGLLLLADARDGGTLQTEAAALPSEVARSLRENEPIVRAYAEDRTLARFIFLGSGPFYALAAEAALKVIEMALTPAHFYPMLEFRHGPHLLLSPETLLVIFPAEAEGPYVNRVIEEARAAEARVLLIGARAMETSAPQLILGSRVSELLRPILFAHLIQQLALWRAAAVGVNPDAPPRLTRIVRWNE